MQYGYDGCSTPNCRSILTQLMIVYCVCTIVTPGVHYRNGHSNLGGAGIEWTPTNQQLSCRGQSGWRVHVVHSQCGKGSYTYDCIYTVLMHHNNWGWSNCHYDVSICWHCVWCCLWQLSRKSYTLKSLREGQEYELRVSAENAVGQGAYSQSIFHKYCKKNFCLLIF